MIDTIRNILKSVSTSFEINFTNDEGTSVVFASNTIVMQQLRIKYGKQLFCEEDAEDIGQLANVFKSLWDDFMSIHSDEFNKIYNTLMMTYNPIHNYDRTENTETTYEKGTETNTTDYGATTTKTDGEYYTNTSISTYDGNLKDESEVLKGHSQGASDTESKSGQDVLTRNFGDDKTTTESTISGNIGVTTTQQMISSEIILRKYNLLDDILARFVRMYCYTGWEGDSWVFQ